MRRLIWILYYNINYSHLQCC